VSDPSRSILQCSDESDVGSSGQSNTLEKEDENDALTTPMASTGTPEELEAELGSTLVSYTGSHLQLKSTLENAQAEMAAAAKAAKSKAQSSSKTPLKKEGTSTTAAKPAQPQRLLRRRTQHHRRPPASSTCRRSNNQLPHRIPQLRSSSKTETRTTSSLRSMRRYAGRRERRSRRSGLRCTLDASPRRGLRAREVRGPLTSITLLRSSGFSRGSRLRCVRHLLPGHSRDHPLLRRGSCLHRCRLLSGS
jgi:PRTRC genetic system protein E